MLYDAAMCRAEADWLVGINATRALTCKYNAQLSCGRVQTPTLAMIAAREKEIKNFVPQCYYGLLAKWNPGTVAGKSGGGSLLSLTWQDGKSKSFRSFDRQRIEELKKALSGKDGIVKEVKRTPKKKMAPLLYDRASAGGKPAFSLFCQGNIDNYAAPLRKS